MIFLFDFKQIKSTRNKLNKQINDIILEYKTDIDRLVKELKFLDKVKWFDLDRFNLNNLSRPHSLYLIFDVRYELRLWIYLIK